MKAIFLIGLISLGLTSVAPSAYAALLISVDKSAQTLTRGMRLAAHSSTDGACLLCAAAVGFAI